MRRHWPSWRVSPLTTDPSEQTSLSISLFTPLRERCGISDYSRHLIEALEQLPEIASLRTIAAPEEANFGGTLAALRHFLPGERRFRSLGQQMNADAQNIRADIAHIQHQYFFFGGVAPHKNHAAAFLDALRVPCVMTVHEIAGASASGLKRALLNRVNHANFLHPVIRQWIVHTEADRERLTTLGADPNRIHVIPVGIPSALPMPSSEEAKRTLGLEKRKVITLFGFLSTKKGHLLALEMMEKVQSRHTDWTLLLAGDQHPDDHTDYVASIRARIEQAHLSSSVQITGYLPDARIPTVMAATDVAIAPFLESSGSASLAHLFAYGLPVVASDISPHRQIVQENPGALLLFPSGDAEALERSIEQVLQPETGTARTLHIASQEVAGRQSYAEMARRTLGVYRMAQHT